MTLDKYTKVGKILFWIGLAIFVVGLGFNENLTDAPEQLAGISRPIMITGIVVVFLTNFFRKKKTDRK
ncbi:hypothetical protein [Salinibacillus xinjiangensis]|uniref:DUF3098 domain-containing protein n=1 Tax=Salinibacillus xinjiangensis TaxID=1229268 RepID=A0A6G1X983_9BACI|nr:hypothetical protein [Salinibacillus xinjiangensis]MRG87502.1 hypothetical protein [Salinibacillus xinjiangensis]